MEKDLYVYAIDGFCYKFIRLYENRCSLHGEFISSGFHAVKIKHSGKVRNCCTYLQLKDLHKESADRMILKFPQLLKTKD